MRKIIVFIALIYFGSINGYSQRISTTELMNLMKFNQDDLDTYLVTKGYKFSTDDNSENENIKNDCTHFYKYVHKLKIAYKIVSYKCKYSDYALTFSTTTPNENDYLLYKKEIKNKGFKFVESFDWEGAKFLRYELKLGKHKYTASLISKPSGSYEINIDYL